MNPLRHRPPVSWIAGLVALATFWGCDFFRPADPEPPSAPAILVDYSDPDATLRTMARAIADKARTNGATAYLGALAESTTASTPAFRQIFWPEDRAAWEEVAKRKAPDWTLPLEVNFYSRFMSLRGDEYAMQWRPDETRLDELGPDRVTIHRHYLVHTQDADGNITGTLAIGIASLTLYRAADARWRVTRWEDRPDPSADPNSPEERTMGLRRLETQ